MGTQRVVWAILGHVLLFLAAKPALAQEAPTGFNGSAQSTSSIQWSWNDTTGESFYIVHDAETEAVVDFLPADQTAYLEENLAENTRYARHVHASHGGQTSPPSNDHARYTLVHDPTDADLALAAPEARRVEVTVTPPPNAAEGQTGVEIARSDTGVVAGFAPVYAYTDTAVEPETEYCYSIRFRNGDGIATANSYTECVTTPGEPPPPEACRTRIDIPERPVYLPEGDALGDEMKPGNKVVAFVWWEDEVGHGPERKHINVQLFPTQFPGQCTNSGERSYDDFTIEKPENEGNWDLGADLVYGGTQSLTARTKEPVPAGFRVPVVLTSYDWGGFVTVYAEAEGCEPAQQDAVQDDDKDLLPNAFEEQSSFWSTERVLTPFDPKNANTPGGGGRDTQNDRDLDDRDTPVHTVFGDGLTAREEYRGVKVNGVVKRTRDLIDQRTQARPGGTHVKDFFALDQKRRPSGDALFFPNSRYLADSGLIWHTLASGDVLRNGAFIPMNPRPTGDGDQFAIRIATGGDLRAQGRNVIALSDRSVKTGEPILVDAAAITAISNQLGVSFEDLLDWVVSHEIHHKLGMGHNQAVRTFVQTAPAEPNRTNFWRQGNGPFSCHILLTRPRQQYVALEFVEKALVGNREEDIQSQGLAQVLRGATMNVHGHDHFVGSYRTNARVQRTDVPNLTLLMESHERNLMDPVINPPEAADVKNDPLTEDQEKQPNVRS